MTEVPPDLRFAKSHEWVRVDGGTATIGISDHAQQELTDLVFVELPEVGRSLVKGEASAVVESVKTASDIYSPVNGKVIEMNQAVADNPELVNAEPYSGGWLFKLELSNASDLDTLLNSSQYNAQVNS